MTAQQPGLVGYVRDQITPGLTAVGGFVKMCVLTAKALFRGPFQWRESVCSCEARCWWSRCVRCCAACSDAVRGGGQEYPRPLRWET